MTLLRYILLVILVAMFSAQLQAATNNRPRFRTPENIINMLDSLYPGPKDVQWSRKRKRYTADFIYKGLNVSTTFDKNANVLSSLEEIPFESLPERVQEKVKHFYESYKVVIVLRRKSGDSLQYDIEVIKGKQQYILNYHPKGFLIHQYEVYKFDASTDFSN